MLGHRQLALVDVDLVEGLELGDAFGVVDLVGIDHRREQQLAVLRAHRREVLLRAHDEASDADLLRPFHGLGQQGVGLHRRLVGSEVVGRVVENRVDVGEVDELLDVDRAHGFGVEGGQLVVVDEDVLA